MKPTVIHTKLGAPVYVERACSCGKTNDAADTLCGSCGADLSSAPTTMTTDFERYLADLAACFKLGGQS